MKYFTSILLLLLMGLLSGSVAASHQDHRCAADHGLTLQILGSGGPIADDGWASTAYLLWINGRSRLLVDAGGGSFLRFGEAGASFADLKLIAISHFHTDHSADLPALLKSGYFSARTGNLSISGPAGDDIYPGIKDYLGRLLDPDKGVYAYLSGYLDGSGGLVRLEPIEIDPQLNKAERVYADPVDDMEVFALGVPHGPVPALAYRVRIGQKSIVLAGDQNGRSEDFVKFAAGADLLVMHMAVPEGISGVARNLHATPGIIGNIATRAGAGKLVLSHFMARSLDSLDNNLEIVRSVFAGTLVDANDLDCVGF